MINKSKKQEENTAKKKDDDWMTKKWRPMMAIMYMVCCLMDFAVFPIMFTIVQFWETQAANDAFRQWVPITLQGGGLFHVAMGAVLGVSAFGRTQEKIAGASATPAPAGLPVTNLTTTPAPGFAQPMQPATFNPAPVTNSFGAQPLASGSGFGTPNAFGPLRNVAPGNDFAPAVGVGFGGKKAPPEMPQPLL